MTKTSSKSESKRFRKWKILLAEKYTKSELADLLQANSHRRISKLLLAAYTKKVVLETVISTDSPYELVKRFIPIYFRVYNILEASLEVESWDKFQKELEQCTSAYQLVACLQSWMR
jgi:hypothetical protein